MAEKKDRVIAIDYFRGICILMVVINHSAPFSKPFTYLGGAGGLWTSAAELFFLLSGITLMIVRGKSILQDFKRTTRKLWRRAALIYFINIFVVTLSLILALLLPADTSSALMGTMPAAHGLSLLWQILTFQCSVGLAGFLMYYSVFLIFAPLILYAMLTRLWSLVLTMSFGLFVLSASHVLPENVYSTFALWQLYFVLGIAIARIRIPFISWFYNLPKAVIKNTYTLLATFTTASIAVAALLSFNIYPTIDKLTNSGWLPVKLRSGYVHLLNNEPTIDLYLRDGRYGILRPIATILFFFTGYILYQKYKRPLLNRTGDFVNAMGRDTLWIFVAQALAIPIFAALPISHNNIVINFLMTALLMYTMWLVTKRHVALAIAKGYANLISDGLAKVKYAYLYRTEDNL